MSVYSIIIGSGKYIPNLVVKNEVFLSNSFFNDKGEKILKKNEDIINKLQEITEIEERRYLDPDLNTSDMAFYASEKAISDAGIDSETLDYIIVAHNFGDIRHDNQKSDLVPTLASRVKHLLKIENPDCVAYDLPFGCPGWLQGVIQADYYIKSGDAKRILVIGAETLSRISDPHDIDSMIYSDGAGAVILEGKSSDTPIGILAHKTRTDTLTQAHYLKMDISYDPDFKDNTLFLKMNGRKLYEYALTNVPLVVKQTIEKAGLTIQEIKKVLIHQANAKMDAAILARTFKLFEVEVIPEKIMPMSISKLGNNSVATIPILYDMIVKEELEDQAIHSGDYLVLASVGAGMNVNALIYLVP
ncbi:3-oxoacyl-ACP synthase [Rhodonellum psychrophilum GCM71 = DSM 17998]|uniref:3-oxoacyl-ACP synthase n=2 Tax=Rhodonellum TaxID=336827 RepID=U5BRT3_9BACT|nr:MULTISPECIES: ketoacyl-ACP synthase III [Rhodonellum]ERM83295.1 3-oxoacyl-ACP synthase [Rhodonellum psychrophilum GCM71 = DSM 17998]SDZ50209.1 3-oxoacyl-[acyl-carrier-protein] synthase-3 [Rhodonellum ikkaensis]